MKPHMFLLILCIVAASAKAQDLDNPFPAGSYSSSFSFTRNFDTRNYQDAYACVSFTITRPMRVEFTTCGSHLSDTYIFLYDMYKRKIDENDDSNNECGVYTLASLEKELDAGIYYIAVRGYNYEYGNITINIHAFNEMPLVYNNIGSYNDLFTYVDTQNTVSHNNNYGHSTNEIGYKFTINRPMAISVSLCGSEISGGTCLYLLSSSQQLLSSGYNMVCPDNKQQAYLWMILEPGTYYVIAEGFTENGRISISIEGDHPVPESFMDLNNPTRQSFEYSETEHTEWWCNQTGESSGDITYRMELAIPMIVTISHCSSDAQRTAIYLWDVDLHPVNYTPLPAPEPCSNPDQAYLRTYLEPGVYYIISETLDEDDYITISIKGDGADPMEGTKTQNYIYTRTMTDDTGTQFMDVVQYFDGLGRPIETVQRKASPQGFDLVAYQEYDAYGRESNAWLPKVATSKTGAFVPLTTFKTLSSDLYLTDNAYAYSKPVYENSPLNRILEQYGPGESWHNSNHSVRTAYMSNKEGVDTLNCVYYTAATATSDMRLTVKRIKNYDSGELFANWVKDEDGNTALEFKDKLDRVILNRHIVREGTSKSLYDTYYIYDNYNKLVAVLPPAASDILKTENDTTKIKETLHQYAYLYKHDKRNRCIAKKLPGCSWTYYVYDKADRLIFSQNGEQRLKGEWMFTLPDAFDRACVSGICKNTFDAFAVIPLAKVVTVERDGTATKYKGYSLPDDFLVNTTVLNVNYYDDYSFLDQSAATGFNKEKFSFTVESGFGNRSTATKTLLTGALVAKLEDPVTSSYLATVMYYDNRKRMIQSISSNHLGGDEKEHVLYDFVGKPLKRKHVHTIPAKDTQTENYVYTYDHAGRLKKTTHQLTVGASAKPQIVLAENAYDELGRLASSGSNGKTNLASTYKYNVRSWINTITNPLFTEGLTYSYSGNINTQQWTQANKTRKYTFAYDELSRLLSATYNGDGNYNTSYAYDKQGSITHLRRYGNINTTTYGVVDSLTMSYSGNQLVRVNDSGVVPSLSSSADFHKYGSAAPVEYTYDTNGNMKSDKNKGITEIKYSLLNLPMSLSISNPLGQAANKYVYTAGGKKLSVSKGSFTTDYVGNMIYENGNLKRILVDNGYYENGIYYFYIRDHLGSNRVVADQNGNIVQSTQYYPFGMAFADGLEPNKQPYKYNGKALDSDRGLNLYDYEARQKTSDVPGFTTPDPMMEKYYSWSPYVYCKNNPINRIDPTGMDDYYNENGELIYTDNRTTNELRTLSNADLNFLFKMYRTTLFDRTETSLALLKDLDKYSKIIDTSGGGELFADLWKDSMTSGNETAGLLVFNFKEAKITFERLDLPNATPESGGYFPQKAGDKYKGGIVLGNVHTHPTEHTYLGKIAADTGLPITDSYNFSLQYEKDGDGRRANKWQGANYTVSKYNVDYFSPKGIDYSVNNLTNRRNLQNNKFNLLKHSLQNYGK